MEMNPIKNISYEDAMKELEGIVNRLDTVDGTLVESIVLFQRGIELTKLCSNKLEEIEKKIRIITEKGEEPFVVEE